MKTTPCKGCGKPIVWAKNTQTGAIVPLDPRPPVYVVEEWMGETICSKADSMVSHFATCPKANQFSGKAKRNEKQQTKEA